MENKSIWEKYSQADLRRLDKLCDEYREFLSKGKTERECVDMIVNAAEADGYRELEGLTAKNAKLKPGDKVYRVWMNKTVCLFRIGKGGFENGMNILGAHIDSPRMDLKSNPLYEKDGLALLDTHYYGGIKKYQWVTLPLALHGVIVKKDGSTVELSIGEDEDDPVFFISDLLIHLAAAQLEKKAAKVIEGDALDLIVGNAPIRITKEDVRSAKESAKKPVGAKAGKAGRDREIKEKVKAGVLDILKMQYDVEEEDFLSAEIEVVPAGKARDAGFDRSMILGYGQDDRVCAFTSLKAMLDLGAKTPERTVCCILVDKEEIGSVGATGMHSRFFENTVAEVMERAGEYSDLALRRCLERCHMLSSDVSAAFDPNFEIDRVFEKRNCAYLGRGMVFNKFTGARGKSGSNDANAEYIAQLRSVFEREGIDFQFAELGRVDAGGGGTIAYILAEYGMNVIDSGVAVLNMHAPWEATSKADIYETYRGYLAFVRGIGTK